MMYFASLLGLVVAGLCTLIGVAWFGELVLTKLLAYFRVGRYFLRWVWLHQGGLSEAREIERLEARIYGMEERRAKLDGSLPGMIAPISREDWPDGISDGLNLPCSICDAHVYFDYTISDEVWREIVSERYRRGVVCLKCLSLMSSETDSDQKRLAQALERVQFVGAGYTVVLEPVLIVRHLTPKEDPDAT